MLDRHHFHLKKVRMIRIDYPCGRRMDQTFPERQVKRKDSTTSSPRMATAQDNTFPRTPACTNRTRKEEQIHTLITAGKVAVPAVTLTGEKARLCTVNLSSRYTQHPTEQNWTISHLPKHALLLVICSGCPWLGPARLLGHDDLIHLENDETYGGLRTTRNRNRGKVRYILFC